MKKQLSLFEETKFTPTLKETKNESLVAKGFILSPKSAKTFKRKSRADGIYLPEEKKPLTYGLRFEEKRQRIPEWALPEIHYSKDKVKEIIINHSNLDGYGIGLDFEYNPTKRKISVVGVAWDSEAAACSYDDEIGNLLYTYGVVKNFEESRFVGHFVLGADKPVLEEAIGKETPLWLWEDSMISHYLCAAQLAKAPGKADDGEGGLGMMSLGFAAHLWTNLIGWKHCRGLYCEGPCPSHSVFDYCAVDAWAGLQVYKANVKFMSTKGIPRRVYEEHKELALNFCLAAEKRGMIVDLDYARKLEDEMEKKKENLFPKGNPRFNPRSNIQVVKWFEKNGLKLTANDKGTVELALEARIHETLGLTSIGEIDDESEALMDEVTRALYDLYIFKSMGKGTDAWVAEKYITYE
mgnify:CR=1 FL=1